MNELGKGNHLPPVRDHVRWVSSRSLDYPDEFVGSIVVCRTHDEGAADRAAALYAKTFLHADEPCVRRHGIKPECVDEMLERVGREVTKMLTSGSPPVRPSDAVYVQPFARADRQVVTHRRVKDVQCKHLPETNVLRVVEVVQELRGHTWANRWDVAREFPEIPFRVVSAKLNGLVRRGLLSGCCTCHDCRGDFELTDRGRALLNS